MAKNERKNNETKAEGVGLPYKKQLFGGFSPTQVMGYLDKLIVSVEAEKKELEEEKKQIYDLMQKGQIFSDHLRVEAKAQAAAIVQEAKQTASVLIQEANDEVDLLHAERARALVQCKTEAQQCIRFVTQGYQEMMASYGRILAPLTEFSKTLEGEEE